MTKGDRPFQLGFNLPWIHYGHDFGRNAWGHDGLSAGRRPPEGAPPPQSAIEDAFRIAGMLRGAGFTLLRVFVFCDGRAAPSFNPPGAVSGLDREFFEDFDALLECAARTGVRLIPVLLDFHWWKRARLERGVQTGGRGGIVLDAALRRSFLDRALAPLLARYGKSPWIAAWEVVNEPEWACADVPGRRGAAPDIEAVPLEAMRDFVGCCAAEARQLAAQPVTLGCAQFRWLPLWKGLGLDIYQFHWYDAGIEEGNPFPWPAAAELGLDRPCWIGEAPTGNSRAGAREFIAAARNGGYQALLFWSLRAGDRYTDLAAALAGLESGPRLEA